LSEKKLLAMPNPARNPVSTDPKLFAGMYFCDLAGAVRQS
jgi:hypothetical protein